MMTPDDRPWVALEMMKSPHLRIACEATGSLPEVVTGAGPMCFPRPMTVDDLITGAFRMADAMIERANRELNTDG